MFGCPCRMHRRSILRRCWSILRVRRCFSSRRILSIGLSRPEECLHIKFLCFIIYISIYRRVGKGSLWTTESSVRLAYNKQWRHQPDVAKEYSMHCNCIKGKGLINLRIIVRWWRFIISIARHFKKNSRHHWTAPWNRLRRWQWIRRVRQRRRVRTSLLVLLGWLWMNCYGSAW